MDLHLDRTAPLPLGEQIRAQIRLRVRRGALRPGQALPTIKDLAERLEVNPNTVAAAYRALEREGLLVTRRRAGTRVADAPPPPAAAEALAARLGDDLGRRLAELGLPLADALPALAAAAAGPSGSDELRIAVLARTPLAAEVAARRTAAVLGPETAGAPGAPGGTVRCIPVAPERYRSVDYHLTVIDPELVPALRAAADVIPPPPPGAWRYGPDFPAGAD